MPATQQPKPAGFGMGQTAPPIVPGRPYDWTIKPGKRNDFERKLPNLKYFSKSSKMESRI